MKKAYKWNSKRLDICVKAPYPAPSRFSSFNKCFKYGAEYLISDQKFGKEYMTMRKSNWSFLGKEMYKMIMYAGGMEEACNQNQYL